MDGAPLETTIVSRLKYLEGALEGLNPGEEARGRRSLRSTSTSSVFFRSVVACARNRYVCLYIVRFNDNVRLSTTEHMAPFPPPPPSQLNVRKVAPKGQVAGLGVREGWRLTGIGEGGGKTAGTRGDKVVRRDPASMTGCHA